LKTPRVPPYVLGFSLFLAISPLAYAFVMDMALTRDAIEYQRYLDVLWVFRCLATPGLLVSKLFLFDPSFWVEHSRGPVFWQDLTGFLVFNLLGWTLSLTLIRAAFRAVALKLRSARNTRLNAEKKRDRSTPQIESPPPWSSGTSPGASPRGSEGAPAARRR